MARGERSPRKCEVTLAVIMVALSTLTLWSLGQAIVTEAPAAASAKIRNREEEVLTVMLTTGMRPSPVVTTRMDVFALATFSLGAAAIHFAVIGEHFAEYFLFGVFFSVLGWFEALWALAYVVRPARRLAGAAFLVNGATVLIWAWAHLVGLPFGPDPGQVEPTTITDLMATLFEIVLVIGLVSPLISRPQTPVSTTPARVAVFALLIAAVAFGTTVALAQPAAMGS